MIHLTKYKLFESTKLSIDNLDLIEIESCIIEHIDSGEIEITDYIISKVHLILNDTIMM